MGLLNIACSVDEFFSENVLQEIKLISNISLPTRGSNLNEQNELINLDQQVGVTIIGASSTHNNNPWISDGTGNLNYSGSIYYVGNTTAYIYAYQPYNSTWTDVVGTTQIFTVQTDQSAGGYANSDLLWATATADKTTPTVNLTFSHMLTKVNVELTVEDDIDLNGSTITLNDVKTTVEFQNGMVTLLTGYTTDVVAGTSTTQATAIIVPQTISFGSKFISITLNDGSTYSYSPNTNQQLCSGKMYCYKLKMTKDKLLILNSTYVNPWEEGNGNNNNVSIQENHTEEANEYLHFVALEDGCTVYYTNENYNVPDMLYSYDKQTWTPWNADDEITLDEGEFFYVKGNNPNGFSVDDENYSSFSTYGEFACSGNIMSLLYGDNFAESDVIPSDYCFYGLFFGTSITSAPALPATTLTEGCYSAMFAGCETLEEAPELPATNLVNGCYDWMFYQCTNLNSVKVAFAIIPEDVYSFSEWLTGTAETGTFSIKSNSKWEDYIDDDLKIIPKGWTIETY